MATTRSKSAPVQDVPASVPPKTAIELLNRQIQKVSELILNGPVVHSDLTAWKATTKDYLIRAFGSASPNIDYVMHASGDLSLLRAGRPRNDDAFTVSALHNHCKMLRSCIEQLETDIELSGSSSSNEPKIPIQPNNYDTAQICPNGHVINDVSERFPQFNKKFCEMCGEETLTECPNCSTAIRGSYHSEGRLSVSDYSPPAYCYSCGSALPWTELKIQTAIELATESDNLSPEEIEKFEDTVKEIVRDTPRTQLGATRFMKVMTKVGGGTANAIKDVLVDIVSETAKKMIWPT